MKARYGGDSCDRHWIADPGTMADVGGTHKIDFASSPSETVATPSRRLTTSIGNVGANGKAKHKSKEEGDRKKDINASCEGMYGVQDHDP